MSFACDFAGRRLVTNAMLTVTRATHDSSHKLMSNTVAYILWVPAMFPNRHTKSLETCIGKKRQLGHFRGVEVVDVGPGLLTEIVE